MDKTEALPGLSRQGMPASQADRADAVAELYDAYSLRIYRFLRYRLSSDQQAEDLTGAVFERVIERLHTYRPERGSMEVWIFRIARNLLTDHFRRHRETIPLDLLIDQADPDPLPEEQVQRACEHRLLDRALATLGEREATVLSLRYAAELSNREIARVLGLSEKNVGVILHRSKKKLRATLEREGFIWTDR